MKPHLYLVLLLTLLLFYNPRITGQCVPDVTGCIDIDAPGQICPDTLAEGKLGIYYEETVTVIPPSEATLDGGLVFTIAKIVIDSIGNLPPGIQYYPNAAEFYPDTVYCILLSGTPTVTGTYFLYIRVIPYIFFQSQVIQGGAQVNDTSLYITIHPATGITEVNNVFFTRIENTPNPFIETTVISFYHVHYERVELKVFNLSGERVYFECKQSVPGKNVFDFDGRILQQGTYIYKVTSGKETFTRKLVKLE